MIISMIIHEKNGPGTATAYPFYGLQSQSTIIYRDSLDIETAHGYQFVGHRNHLKGRGTAIFQKTHIVDQVRTREQGGENGKHGFSSCLGIHYLGIRGSGKGPDRQAIDLVSHVS